VAAVEVRESLAEARGDVLLQSVDAVLDVDGQRTVRGDEVYRGFGVRGIRLHPIREPHRDELRLVTRGPHTLDGELGEPAGECGVLPAGDSQHVALRARG